jgi:hypothetical protein
MAFALVFIKPPSEIVAGRWISPSSQYFVLFAYPKPYNLHYSLFLQQYECWSDWRTLENEEEAKW